MALDILEHLVFFKGLTEADLQLLAPYFKLCLYPTGTTIFEQGDTAEFLYLMVRGEVVIRYKPEDGPTMTVTHILPGCVFGWSAALGNVAYTSEAECATDCEVLQVNGAQLRSLCDSHPEMGKIILDRLSAVIAERWQNRQAQVVSILAQGINHQQTGEHMRCEEIDMKKDERDPQKELQMKALVEQLSAYIEHFHGGSVEYIDFNGKVLHVRLGGACLGCPLSPATLHGWVEGTVRQFFPDIEGVEAV